MPYTINHNASLGVIELTYSGRITGDDLKEATSKCISLGKQTDTTKFLVDEVGMDLTASIADLFNLNKQYADEGANRQAQVAVILPASQEAKKSVQFYEIACQNYGWKVRVFSERQSAMNWLKDNVTPDKSDPEATADCAPDHTPAVTCAIWEIAKGMRLCSVEGQRPTTTQENMQVPEHFEVKEGYSCYRLSGHGGLEEAARKVIEVIIFSREQGIRNLLIDTTGWTGHRNPDTLERYTVAQAFAEAARQSVKLAMVVRPEMMDPEKFEVMVATNQGMAGNVFDSEKDALAWLLDPTVR